MNLTPVTSTSIKAIGHDPKTNSLRVQFHNGGHVYEYPGVTAEKHQALVSAKSIGQHFQQHIRPHHAGKKVQP